MKNLTLASKLILVATLYYSPYNVLSHHFVSEQVTLSCLKAMETSVIDHV